MHLLSPALDFALAVACLLFARDSVRRGGEFFFAGYLWIAAAAFIGSLRLAGVKDVGPTHDFLTDVGRGAGMFLLALGVLTILDKPWPGSRWMAIAISIVAPAAVHVLGHAPVVDTINLLLGSTLLLSLLLLATRAIARGKNVSTICAAVSLTAFLAVGFGVQAIPLSSQIPVRHVDITHILLIVAYAAMWKSVRELDS